MKNLSYKLLFLSTLFMALFTTSCYKSNKPHDPQPQEVQITLNTPVTATDATLSDIAAAFTNISDKKVTNAQPSEISDNVIKLTLLEGKYNAHITAKIHYTNIKGEKTTTDVMVDQEIDVKLTAGEPLPFEITVNFDQPKFVKITLNQPLGVTDANYENIEASFTDISTGNTVYAKAEDITNDQILVELNEGSYKSNIIAELHMINKTGIKSIATIEINEEIDVKYGSAALISLEFTPDYQPSTSGFVIDEIYFSPSMTPEGKTFTYVEQYIKITNNSDETLYADGIAILESKFLTNMKYDYKPNIMSEALAIGAIALIPGDGTEHPVAPGESLIIANNAQDHTKVNPNAVDLSNADFEWYDDSPNPNFQDVDNPEVPNLDKWYAATATVHSFHQRGATAIALAKMDTTKDQYLKDYKYDYTWLFVFNDFSKEMSGSAYKVPNAWILDAVNLSMPAGDHGFEWIVTDPSLDSGWTGWRDSFNDKTAAGLAVRRKVESENDHGRKYLMDTNNSTNDFERRVKPSLKK